MSEQEELVEELQDKRKALIDEIKIMKYSNIEITSRDKKANELYHQKVEPNFKFEEDFYYNLSMKYKSLIESNPFFKDLQKMPKGALLHHHLTNCIDIDWISQEVMKEENLKNIYMRRYKNKYDILIYTLSPNKLVDTPFKDIIEKYLKDNTSKSVKDYFHSKLSLSPNELDENVEKNQVMEIFMEKYYFCIFLIMYKNFYTQHIKNTFMQCVNDKIYRLETRINLGKVRDENFNTISLNEELELYKNQISLFNDSVDLEEKFTFGIIVELLKNENDEDIKKAIQRAIELKENYPDLICGIDFYGDEDNERSIQNLEKVMINNNCPELPWILHCGESLKGKNYNLVDGAVMNSKRFGHCLNLFKMGTLYEYVKNKEIAIECCPIANQSMKQVRDLRLHPSIWYHNNGIKVCINNDNPTIFDTKGIGYDFFVACAAMEFDLLDMKCFGLNSIDAAEISNGLRNYYKVKFLKKWNNFVEYFISKYEK